MQAEISSTEITAIFGKSGAGKTTFLNIIAGLIRPSNAYIKLGSLVLNDSNNNIFIPPEERRIGYVFQDLRLFPHLTVNQNLLFYHKLSKSQGSTPKNYTEIIRVLNLVHLINRLPNALSGGEVQRVAIGRALLSNPRMLILDEPLSGLDNRLKFDILDYLKNLSKQKAIPILYISHQLKEISYLSDWIVMMENGRLTKSGHSNEIIDSLQNTDEVHSDYLESRLTAKVVEHDADLSLTRLRVAEQTLSIQRVNVPIGEFITIYLQARNIAVASSKPTNISILNILEGSIISMHKVKGEPHNNLRIALDRASNQQIVWAQITKAATIQLNLSVGMSIFLLVKTVSIRNSDITIQKPRNSHI